MRFSNKADSCSGLVMSYLTFGRMPCRSRENRSDMVGQGYLCSVGGYVSEVRLHYCTQSRVQSTSPGESLELADDPDTSRGGRPSDGPKGKVRTGSFMSLQVFFLVECLCSEYKLMSIT